MKRAAALIAGAVAGVALAGTPALADGAAIGKAGAPGQTGVFSNAGVGNATECDLENGTGDLDPGASGLHNQATEDLTEPCAE